MCGYKGIICIFINTDFLLLDEAISIPLIQYTFVLYDSSPGSSLSNIPEQPTLKITPQEIPPYGEYFDIFVTYAASPSNFVVSII